LASEKEIHSTEKLLNLIRNEGQAPPGSARTNATTSPTAAKSRCLKSSLPAGKKHTVGVDIGHTYIKLAKVVHNGGKQFELVDYLTVTPSWSFTLNDKKFQDLLESTLDQFCSDGNHYEFWSAIPSAKVEIRYLRIPKLPRKQVPNAIFWTFTKMVDFNEADEILDFEVLGDVIEQGVKKTEVVAFKVPRQEVAALKQVYEKIGYPLKGITIVPFGVQNLFRTGIVAPTEDDVCSLFVGRDWSRIAIYSKGHLVLTRGIRAGMQSMVEAINKAMLTPEPVESDGAAEPPTFIHPDAQRAFLNFLGVTGGTDVSAEEAREDGRRIFKMLLPAMDRLVRQVERTFEHYSQTFHRESVRRVYFSGRVFANPVVSAHIGRQLDLPVSILDPFASGTAFSENINIPESPEERESYAPAIGMAISSNSITPNILFTHSDREQFESIRRFNSRVLGFCMIGLLALIGYFSWQGRSLDTQRDITNKLAQQLAVYQPPAEKELIVALFAKTREKRQAVAHIAERYAPVAIISELSQVTPPSVRLLDLQIALPQTPTGAKAPVASRTIFLEGLIFGSGEEFESVLANYLLGLKNSPIFQKPEIQDQHFEFYNNQEVLRFKAKLEVM
jgi:Tfp pilus assembly PilM family ATPase